MRGEMTQKLTIREVAAAAGVSLGTVSRVLNGAASVRPGIRTRVLDAMRALGYQPNTVAQSMRRQDTRVIGCLVTFVSHPVFTSTVTAAEAVLREAGYAMVLANTADRTSREVELFDFFKRRRVDGLITTLGREDDPEAIQALRNLQSPVVLLEREVDGPFDSVVSDNGGGCYTATRYLLELGHRRIALVTSAITNRPGRERQKNFRQAHADFGLQPEADLMRTWISSAEFGFSESYALLSAPSPPTAVIAGVHELVGLMRAVRVLKLRVPEDISVIAFGDSDLAELMTPPITVVRWAADQLGRIAAELLLARLKKGSVASEPRCIMLPTEFVLRQSCAPPRRHGGEHRRAGGSLAPGPPARG